MPDSQPTELTQLDIALALQRIAQNQEHYQQNTMLHREWLKETVTNLRESINSIKEDQSKDRKRVDGMEKKQWTFAGIITGVALIFPELLKKYLHG